jgi:hypothetical protein
MRYTILVTETSTKTVAKREWLTAYELGTAAGDWSPTATERQVEVTTELFKQSVTDLDIAKLVSVVNKLPTL